MMNLLCEIYHLIFQKIIRRILRNSKSPRIPILLNNFGVFYSQKNWRKAESLYKESLSILRGLCDGKPSDKVANALINLATLYEEQGKLDDAESLYLEALSIYHTILNQSEESEIYNFMSLIANFYFSLGKLASFYVSQGKLDDAESLYLEAIKICRGMCQGEPSNVLATSLNNLGFLYTEQSRWNDAEPLYIEAVSIRRQLFGNTDNNDYATSLDNLASLYLSQGRWKEAEPLFLQAVNIRRKLFGNTANNDLATSLNNLALLYLNQGQWDDAELLSLECLEIFRKLLKGNQNIILANPLNNLALIYTNQGRWNEAEPLYLEAISILRREYAQRPNADLAISLRNLSGLYLEKGRLNESESLMVESLLIFRQLFNESNNNFIANSLDSLGLLYFHKGSLDEAEPIFIEALKIRRNLFRHKPNQDLATSLNNLALLYTKQMKLIESESLYLECLSIYDELLMDKNNKHYARTLGNLGLLYLSQEKFYKAEPLLIESLNIRYHLFGKTPSSDIANSLNNLALLYIHQKKWSDAEPLFIEGLDILNILFGEQGDLALVSCSQNYAFLLVKKVEYVNALKYSISAAKVELRVLLNRFQDQNQKERLGYRSRRQITIDFLLSCLCNYLADNSEAIAQTYEVIYLWKSVTTAFEIALSAIISRSDDPDLKQMSIERQQLRGQLNVVLKNPPSENIETYQQEIKRCQYQLDQLEKAIAAKVPRAELMETSVDRQAINLLVPDGATLVDFVRFDLYDFNTLPDKEPGIPHYLAFILPSGGLGDIRIVKLGAASEIDKLISRFRQAASGLPDVEQLGAISGATLKNPELLLTPYQVTAQNLRQTIFDPLVLPTDHQQIILAPDGDLNLFPFGILPLDNGIVSDRWSIRYISASRDLRPRIQPPKPASIGMIAANPNFDFPGTPVSPTSTEAIQKSGTGTTLNHKLTSLPQTESLAQKIAQLLGIKPLLGNDAQARNLRKLQSPQYFLIATHGLHGLDQTDDNYPDPMRDAGLALTGFNTIIDGNTLPTEFEQGRLTARDLLELDLWGNQISILLACSSGTGYVHQGEGVFGLKRALAIAGASTLIVSLWDVPVQASILLMDKFFEYYQGGKGEPAAMSLQKAQSYICNVSRQELLEIEQGRNILEEFERNDVVHLQGAEYPLLHPIFWGAWICQG